MTVIARTPETLGATPVVVIGDKYVVMDITAAYKGNANWFADPLYGLTKSMVEYIIPKYAYYSSNGKSIYENAGKIVADIKKEKGLLLNTQKVANAIGTMDLAMQSLARNMPDHPTIGWWRGQGGAIQQAAKKVVNTTKSAIETVSDATDEILPWYLKPKTIAVGAVGVGLVYLFLPQLTRSAFVALRESRKK